MDPPDYWLFEIRSGKSGLPNDRKQCPVTKLAVVGNRNSHRRAFCFQFHHNMASALPNLMESMPLQDFANIGTRNDSQFSQRQPLPA